MHFALLIGDVSMTATAGWTWFASAWEGFAQSAGGTVATSMWQGALIVCGLEIAMRLMPRVSAAHRFAGWAAGFGLAAALPVLPRIYAGMAGTGSEIAGPGGSAGALLELDARWGMLIAGAWVAASLVRGALLAGHSMRLRRLWKAAEPVDVSERLRAGLEDVRGGRVEICATGMLDRPSVIGFWAPRILIPEWLLKRVTPGELEQIVQHEAEHLRRRDDWMNLAQKIFLMVFPLNPSLAWMEYRLCGEREMACDEGVVRITKAPRAYAACLASLAERGLERRAEALSLGAWQRRSELVHRVHRILLRRPGMSRAASGAFVGALGCVLAAGSAGMARCPQVVAFVPKQNSLAMNAERQQQLAAMLAREDAERQVTLPANYKAVQAKAVMPAAKRSNLTGGKREGKSSATPARRSNVPGAQQMAMAGDRRAGPDADEKWVVLSAWEEVQTVSHWSGSVADYDAVTVAEGQTISPDSKAGSAGKRQRGGRAKTNGMESQYTFTRLILRVVPAAGPDSSSTQLPVEPVHGGWLVFQL